MRRTGEKTWMELWACALLGAVILVLARSHRRRTAKDKNGKRSPATRLTADPAANRVHAIGVGAGLDPRDRGKHERADELPRTMLGVEVHDPGEDIGRTSETLHGLAPARVPPSTSERCWIPPEKEVQIGRRRIAGGMLYLGSNLSAVSRHDVEPALIDPDLPRQDRQPEPSGQGMSYWPSYSTISPACRSAYLDWLEQGRSDQNAYIGYVFLFLYGLERRALHDAESITSAREELPKIVEEVERLLEIYAKNGSFRGYATQFRDLLRLRIGEGRPSPTVPVGLDRGWELPLAVRVTVAHFALQGIPLPADWAFAWATTDPEMRLRTPAVRCPEEFEELFRRTYAEQYVDGIRLKTCERMIRASYRPASASFGRTIEVRTELPDVTALVGPRRKLAALVESVSDELAPYSRRILKYAGRRNELAAAAVLPKALLDTYAPAAFHELRVRLETRLGIEQVVLLPATEVIEPWLPEDGSTQTKETAVEAVRLLARAGFGIEPDIRFGGRRLARGDKVVLFRLGDEDHESPTPAYAAAALLLHLATTVSAADGEVAPEEERYLRDHLAQGLLLHDAERCRLNAYLQWLLADPPGMTGLRNRLEALTESQRRGSGRFLVQVACADGRVDPNEVKSLTKIFRLLGLDPAAVHQELHAVQVDSVSGEGPVTVLLAGPKAPAYAIPPPGEAGAEEPRPAVTLDTSKIRAKLDESAAVSALLSGIFGAEDKEPEPDVRTTKEETGLLGLDGQHTELARRLGERREWAREEFERLAESLALMPDGAIDALNEVAWETCDEALLEGDDPIEVNLEVYQEMIS